MRFVGCRRGTHLIEGFSVVSSLTETTFGWRSCRGRRHTNIVPQIARRAYRIRYLGSACQARVHRVFLKPKIFLFRLFAISQQQLLFLLLVNRLGFLTFGAKNTTCIVFGLHICFVFLTFQTVQLVDIFFILPTATLSSIDWIIVCVGCWSGSSWHPKGPLAFFYYTLLILLPIWTIAKSGHDNSAIGAQRGSFRLQIHRLDFARLGSQRSLI